jgi:hypothetical protein
MEIKPGRKIALAVNSDWYLTIAAHRFLKNVPEVSHPTNILRGRVEDLESAQGIWLKPDARFSDYPESLGAHQKLPICARID